MLFLNSQVKKKPRVIGNSHINAERQSREWKPGVSVSYLKLLERMDVFGPSSRMKEYTPKPLTPEEFGQHRSFVLKEEQKHKGTTLPKGGYNGGSLDLGQFNNPSYDYGGRDEFRR